MDFPESQEYTERISAAVPPDLREAVLRIVAEHRTTISAVVRKLMEAGLVVYEQEKGGE